MELESWQDLEKIFEQVRIPLLEWLQADDSEKVSQAIQFLERNAHMVHAPCIWEAFVANLKIIPGAPIYLAYHELRSSILEILLQNNLYEHLTHFEMKYVLQNLSYHEKAWSLVRRIWEKNPSWVHTDIIRTFLKQIRVKIQMHPRYDVRIWDYNLHCIPKFLRVLGENYVDDALDFILGENYVGDAQFESLMQVLYEHIVIELLNDASKLVTFVPLVYKYIVKVNERWGLRSRAWNSQKLLDMYLEKANALYKPGGTGVPATRESFATSLNKMEILRAAAE